MSNTDNETNLQHFMDNVWLKRFSVNKKGYMHVVNVCLRLEDKSFVTLGFLNYDNGVYYTGKESIGTINDISFLNYIERITGMKKPKDSGIQKSEFVKSDVSLEEVCQIYKNTNSIKQTAKNVGLSEEKTKKMLVTAGLYTSEKHKKIKDLLDKGKTLDEISELLQMSQKQLRVFLPYNKP